MTGTALPLPARIIGPAFIKTKARFGAFATMYLVNAVPPQDDGRAITSDSGCRRGCRIPHQVSVTDGDFRLFIHFWLGR